MEVRDGVLKSLEEARNGKLIGAPLEARVRLTANGSLYPLLEMYAGELPTLFIVSQVELARAADGELGVEVERAAGRKCERCWKYTMDVGSDERFPEHLRALRQCGGRDFECLIRASSFMPPRPRYSRSTASVSGGSIRMFRSRTLTK